MARLRDDTFEMLVMAQYYVARHEGVDTMEVSIFFIYYLAVLVTAAPTLWEEAGSWAVTSLHPIHL